MRCEPIFASLDVRRVDLRIAETLDETRFDLA
jgi:hypothetical protein